MPPEIGSMIAGDLVRDNKLLHEEIGRLQSKLQACELDAARYAMLKLGDRRSEAFAVLFLNTRHQLIEWRELFQGTIDGATVYPREVVRAVIETNAAAVVFVHNHPSGVPEPSDADRSITLKLQRALALIDVRVLDHIIVAGSQFVSMAERGIL